MKLNISDKFNQFKLPELSSNFKLKLSGISGAFMLPIATMAITGLFLSLGGTIAASNGDTGVARNIGLSIQSISFPILQAFPLLVCISFAIAFTKKETETAIWCSILSFFTFIYFQSPFIDLGDCSKSCCITGNCCGQACACSGEAKCCCWTLLCCYKNDTYKILSIPDAGRNLVPSLICRIFGVTTLNTSIFGPILIGGAVIPYIFKNYSEIKLPTYLSYFSGKRLLPLLCTISVTPIALFSLIFWPWIWTGLSHLGNYISKSKGVDAFIFGFFEKLLIPTGFHHIFASLFWYSPLGGDVTLALKDQQGQNCCELLCCKKYPYLNSLALQGDSLIGLSMLAYPNNQISSQEAFKFLSSKNIWAGRLAQGKFPIMQFALPAAALGIYYSTPTKGRKEKSKTLIPGVWNSIILGITEPIEFSFMYSHPKLFYRFHTIMCGLSFLVMRLAESHIPTSFSGGIIELIINGVITVQKGTNFYYWAAVGSGLAVVYFLTFYHTFSRASIQSSSVESKISTQSVPEEGLSNIDYWKRGLGGWDNVTNYKNCASRLRYDIKDKSKIIESDLKKAGVIAIKWVGDNHVQLIVGPKAEEINSNLSKQASLSSNQIS